MLLTKELISSKIHEVKESLVKITIREIDLWEKYDLSGAYESYWPGEYLNMFLRILIDVDSNDVSFEHSIYTEKDVLNVISRCDEIIYFILKK